MDHLGRTREPFEIPFVVLAKHQYDHLGFHDFPNRMGYDPATLYKVTVLHGWTREDLVSFWQSWLFFGMVIDVMKTVNITVTTDDLVRNTQDGRAVLTTETTAISLA